MGSREETTAVGGKAADARRTRFALINPELLPTIVVLVCAILLVVATKVMNPGSSLGHQLSAVLVTSIFLMVAAYGQGLTILLGGIDLSIGVVIGLSAMMISVLTNGENATLAWALPATLAFCTGVGLINGLGIAFLRVPPFIMTLAAGITFFGVGLGFTSGMAQRPVAPALQTLMSGHWFGVPIPVFLIIIFVIVAIAFQDGSSEGRKLYAIGSSPGAARVLGLPIAGLTILAYAISGLCAGISGILLAGYSSAATLDIGDSLLLPTIAAVVIGGARVTGGKGISPGTLAGALFLSALGTVITVLSLSQGLRNIIEGVIIVGALMVQGRRWGAVRA